MLKMLLDEGVIEYPPRLRPTVTEKAWEGVAQRLADPLTGFLRRPDRMAHRGEGRVHRMLDAEPVVDEGAVPIEEDRARPHRPCRRGRHGTGSFRHALAPAPAA